VVRTKKKGDNEFPPFAERVKRMKLPPMKPGGRMANMPRFYALLNFIAREPKRMRKKRKKG